jgi:hypothetical protein
MDDAAPTRLERRRFLKQAATVAWATPFILTMTSERASAQASCVPTGASCGNYMVIAGIGAVCQPIQGAALCCGVCEPAENEPACRCVEI